MPKVTISLKEELVAFTVIYTKVCTTVQKLRYPSFVYLYNYLATYRFFLKNWHQNDSIFFFFFLLAHGLIMDVSKTSSHSLSERENSLAMFKFPISTVLYFGAVK